MTALTSNLLFPSYPITPHSWEVCLFIGFVIWLPLFKKNSLHWVHWDKYMESSEHWGSPPLQQARAWECVCGEARNKAVSPENFLICEGRSHYLYLCKQPANIWVPFCSCFQLGQHLALEYATPRCFSEEVHFSSSLRSLVPGTLFWFAVVLAIGQLALMVLNILGKYFQQLWLERIQIISKHLHPFCV